MKVKLFGDITPIDWTGLGIKMPFAPLHLLAEKYKHELAPQQFFCAPLYVYSGNSQVDLNDCVRQTFQSPNMTHQQSFDLRQRITYRVNNTMNALDQCTADMICINMGGGYHHAEKYPESGYAYSLINDHIWAVDYQLEQGIYPIQIYDWDFHYPGGTVQYYRNDDRIEIYVNTNLDFGLLHKHRSLPIEYNSPKRWQKPEKILFNISTDLCSTDLQFGKYNRYSPETFLDLCKYNIKSILQMDTPLAITFGGGYGEVGLELYEKLISWLVAL